MHRVCSCRDQSLRNDSPHSSLRSTERGFAFHFRKKHSQCVRAPLSDDGTRRRCFAPHHIRLQYLDAVDKPRQDAQVIVFGAREEMSKHVYKVAENLLVVRVVQVRQRSIQAARFIEFQLRDAIPTVGVETLCIRIYPLQSRHREKLRRPNPLEFLHHICQALLQEFKEDRLLVWKILVDRSDCYLGALGDRARINSLRAVDSKDCPSRAQDPSNCVSGSMLRRAFARANGFLCLRFHRGPMIVLRMSRRRQKGKQALLLEVDRPGNSALAGNGRVDKHGRDWAAVAAGMICDR